VHTEGGTPVEHFERQVPGECRAPQMTPAGLTSISIPRGGRPDDPNMYHGRAMASTDRPSIASSKLPIGPEHLTLIPKQGVGCWQPFLLRD
jgi:hypothetical protein